MMRPQKTYVPQTMGELWDLLGWMALRNPKFVDPPGWSSSGNLETTFHPLKTAFEVVRRKLGEEKFHILMDMADRISALFEADPENSTGDSDKGRALLWQMEDLLRPPRKQE